MCQVEWSDADDFLDRFRVEKKGLLYHDRPLAGFLACKFCDRYYAFDRGEIVGNLLIHWTIVSAQLGDDPYKAMEEAASNLEGDWLSVTEDYRREPLRVIAARVPTAERPPIAPRSYRSFRSGQK
jgi:hypothetical protein